MALRSPSAARRGHSDIRRPRSAHPGAAGRLRRLRSSGRRRIGHVTPHQLRHTLATQAINRSMSRESVAAFLGHASPSMTMTHARISNPTVADEYFAVTAQVEALYTLSDTALPADVENPNMRRLRLRSFRDCRLCLDTRVNFPARSKTPIPVPGFPTPRSPKLPIPPSLPPRHRSRLG